MGGNSFAADVAPLTSKASALMFGSVMFATAALATRAFLCSDSRPFQSAMSWRSSPLDIKSYSSMFTLLFHFSIFGLILFYAYICEYHPPFPHAAKNYDADIFFFMTALLFVVSWFTMKKHIDDKQIKAKESGVDDQLLVSRSDGVAEPNDATEILNRDQTEEWKGWMQFMFLLYHYYHAEEVYNSIRIMITCYVWMTGFGNFSFFYLKADYSSIRVMQMLWRLNFLVAFLCLTQGTTYILYYICLLHTYFFFLVYATMRIRKDLNYTKWGIRIKLGVVALIIFLLWDVDSGLFRLVHYPFFGKTPMLGAAKGSMWEWYFRSTLDHWSTFLGMIFALNFPITSLFYRKLEAQPLVWHVIGKGAMGLALGGALAAWVLGPFMQPKLEYNQTNAYFGFIPLIAYIYFRNLTPKLRNHTLELLHQIGKTTLETYLMQHHIWLTSNAKSLLTLVPGWPKINFLLVSIIYVLLSRRLYQLTLFLRGMVLPDDRNTCIRNLSGLAGFIGLNLLLAFGLDLAGILSLPVIGLFAILSGCVIYQVVVRVSSGILDGHSKTNGDNNSGAGTHSQFSRSCVTAPPVVIGAGLVILLGSMWHHMATTGATRIQRLPESCSTYANDGIWVPVSGCDEGFRHDTYRNYGVSMEATCTSEDKAFLWGWKVTSSASHCRFVHRDRKTLLSSLARKRVLFVGDSMVRFLYHSFCRQMGDSFAGAYNATSEKHGDIKRTIGTTQVDFLWAAFAKNQTQMASAIAEKASTGDKPDIVIMGGGAWDKLWDYATGAEKSSLHQTLDSLALQIQSLKSKGVPVVWMVPTTINSAALPSVEKRERISEEEMDLMRQQYEFRGVLSSASFVIDGPLLSSSRVSESIDGVHYPIQVYSAASQILANSLDWLIDPPESLGFSIPNPGAMAHPLLGLMILCFTLAGLVGFDGFMGFSYVAAIFVPSVAPNVLYLEAFTSLHRRKKLPDLTPASQETSQKSENGTDASSLDGDDEEEMMSLIEKER